jgi:hypothetical protein
MTDTLNNVFLKAIHEKYKGNKLTEEDILDLFFEACEYGYLELIQLIVNKYDINPTIGMNHASRLANEINAIDVLDYFWEDERVKKSLENDEPFIYKAQLIRNKIKNSLNYF